MKRHAMLTMLAVAMTCTSVMGADNTGQTRGSVNEVEEVLGKSPSIPKGHALVIGISKYKYRDEWTLLPHAKDDAQELAKILRTAYGFSDVQELYDDTATKDGITAALWKTAKGLGRSDALLIFYAGHGHHDKVLNRGYWIPSDARKKTEEGAPAIGGWIGNTELVTDYIGAMKTRHVLIVTDACFAGKIFRSGVEPDLSAKENTWYRRAMESQSRWALVSAGSEETPDESIFARKLFLKLTAPPRSVFSTEDLLGWIKAEVSKDTGCFPDARPLGLQDDELSGRFVFVKTGKVPDRETDVSKPPQPGTVVTPPPPPPGNNAKARMAYDDVLTEIAKRDMPFEKQIPYLDDIVKDYPGTTAAGEAKTRIEELRGLVVLVEKARSRFGELTERDKIEVLTQSDANRRRDAWNAYVTEYGKTKHGLDYARQRVAHYGAWKAGPCAGEEKPFDLGGGVELKMMYIPPGEFTMGSPENEAGRDKDETQHKVKLNKGFWMGKYEVTQEQWEKVMGNNPSKFKNAGGKAPVESVSWNDCQEFVKKLNGIVRGGGKFRLPTEAEWEYACRAGTTTPFHYSESLDATMANFDGNYPYGSGAKGEYRQKTVEVGSFQANKWGLYDMHGNVWEWCQDWYGDYPALAVSDPSGPGSGDCRVYRGGS